MNSSDGSLARNWKRTFQLSLLTLGCTVATSGCATGVQSPLSAFFAPRGQAPGTDDPMSSQGSAESFEVPVNPEYAQTASPQDSASVRTASASEASFPTGLVTLQQPQNLDHLIANAPGTVILDFYADWCGPCKKLGKVLHSMESTIKSNDVTVIKVNVDDFPSIKKRFQVKAMPTLVVFQQGQIVKRQVGAPPQSQLLQWISM